MGELIDKIEKWFEGRKTLSVCSIAFLTIAAVNLGWINVDPQNYKQLTDAFVIGAIAALRAGAK